MDSGTISLFVKRGFEWRESSYSERTGAGTVGVFQRDVRFDLSRGLPIVTTKPVYGEEFLRNYCGFKGETNILITSKEGGDLEF